MDCEVVGFWLFWFGLGLGTGLELSWSWIEVEDGSGLHCNFPWLVAGEWVCSLAVVGGFEGIGGVEEGSGAVCSAWQSADGLCPASAFCSSREPEGSLEELLSLGSAPPGAPASQLAGLVDSEVA